MCEKVNWKMANYRRLIILQTNSNVWESYLEDG